LEDLFRAGGPGGWPDLHEDPCPGNRRQIFPGTPDRAAEAEKRKFKENSRKFGDGKNFKNFSPSLDTVPILGYNITCVLKRS
jgi:hypothetical protein